VPPLRERREDIAALVRHFLRKHRHISNGVERDAAPDFLEALTMLDLPGNAREVENLVRSALVHATGDAVTLRDLPRDVWSHLSTDAAAQEQATPGPAAFAGTMLDAHPGNLASALDACERALVREALARSSGNQARTARMLGVTARCVYNKLRKHRLIA